MTKSLTWDKVCELCEELANTADNEMISGQESFGAYEYQRGKREAFWELFTYIQEVYSE